MQPRDSTYVVNLLLTRSSILPGDTAITARAIAMAHRLNSTEDLSLTENEIRLCSMTVIGLYIKQIALILSITPESVQTARYRIKKKLRLSADDSLDDWLRAL